MSDSSLNIYQRINAVREKVEYIQKDKEVQGYKAVTHDQVTSKVRQHFIDHGIVVVPSQISSDYTQVGVTRNNTSIIRYNGWYKIDFVNMDDPEQRISVQIEAHANDQGDKAPGKCISYATKYAILKLLSVETGESEESRMEIAKGMEPIDADQIKTVRDLISETKSDEPKFLKYLGVSDVSEIKKQNFDDVISVLKAKKEKTNGTAQH